MNKHSDKLPSPASQVEVGTETMSIIKELHEIINTQRRSITT